MNSIYAELTADWFTSTGSYETALETSALSSGGKYLIIVNAQVGAGMGDDLNIRVTYDDEELVGSFYSVPARSSSHENRYGYFSMVEPSSATTTIKIQAKSFTSDVRITTASIICLDLQNLVSGSDFIFSESSPNSSNSDSYQEIASVDLPATKPTSGDWLILTESQFEIKTGNVDLYQKMVFKGLQSFPETKQSTSSIGEYKSGYMQRIVSVPYVGYPTHLGGTEVDGSYKKLSFQSKDSAVRPTNNFCRNVKVFALRLNSLQHCRYFQSLSGIPLSTASDFDTVATINDYDPPQDDGLTATAGVFTTGKTVVLGYGGFSPLGTSASHQRCWMDFSWTDGGSEETTITGFSDDSIFVGLSSDEKNPVGFATMQDSSARNGSKTVKMKVKTYSDEPYIYDTSLVILGLGVPVASVLAGPRAYLEMNSVIRLH